jgi:hypothetical protein
MTIIRLVPIHELSFRRTTAMRALTIGMTALMFALMIARPGLAQQKPTPVQATGAYPTTQVDGTGSTYYAMFPGGMNYGLSGTFPNLGGYGYQGYGPGPQFGAHYPAKSAVVAPKVSTPPAIAAPRTSASLDHLAKTLSRSTKKPIPNRSRTKTVRQPAGKKP